MKVLLTSTSFQDTPGAHHDLLNNQGFEIDFLRGPITEDELLPIIQQYDAVICGDDEYTKAVLEKGKAGKLKFLAKYGVGLDRIDLAAAKVLGISVTNCPGVNQVSVAEHVLALLFTFEKNIHLQYQTTKEGSWKRMTGHEIQGSTMGVIGMGAVGKEVVKKSCALGMKVLVFDILCDEQFLQKVPDAKFTNDINQIYKEADVISLHVPHNTLTDRLINEDVLFNKVKKTPIIINTARGKLVDTDAIIKGLEQSKIRAYLTDVLNTEPISSDEKLMGIPNVIITPHVGSRTYESVVRQGIFAVKNLIEQIKEYRNEE